MPPIGSASSCIHRSHTLPPWCWDVRCSTRALLACASRAVRFPIAQPIWKRLVRGSAIRFRCGRRRVPVLAGRRADQHQGTRALLAAGRRRRLAFQISARQRPADAHASASVLRLFAAPAAAGGAAAWARRRSLIPRCGMGCRSGRQLYNDIGASGRCPDGVSTLIAH